MKTHTEEERTSELRWVNWKNAGGYGVRLEQAWIIKQVLYDGIVMSSAKEWRPVAQIDEETKE